MVNPASLAFYGASNNFGSMGSIILASVKGLGFEGPIYPIHPTEDNVQGYPAYRSLDDAPETPDLAVMVLPTAIVPERLEECGRKGVRHAIVVSGGFKEVGEEGRVLEGRLKAVAEQYGIRLLGPNCIGVANPYQKLNTTPFPYLGRPGFIGMASQSGSFITQMYSYLQRLDLGFSSAFSCGNEANVDIVDGLEYLGACPRTRVIALYVEGITRGREFVETARAISPHKPIVALYIGGSESGRRAGHSHTGAMAGPDRLYDGMFRQAGVVRARSVIELFDLCWALGTLPRPKGRRVAVLTDSGGPGVSGADACSRAGLVVPPFAPETLERLRPLVPHTGSINNPVDLTFHRNHMDFYTRIPQALLDDPETDSLMIYFLMPIEMMTRALEQMGLSPDEARAKSLEIIEHQGRTMAELKAGTDKPIVGYTWRSLDEPFIQTLRGHGLPVFPGPERAARALAALRDYDELRRKVLSSGTD